VHSEVDLADIIFSKNSLVSVVGRIVGGNVVQRNSRGKSLASFESFFVHNEGESGFDVLNDVSHLLPWLHHRLTILSDLSVDFRGPSETEDFLLQNLIVINETLVFESRGKSSFVG
jgi:hypothetical protein